MGNGVLSMRETNEVISEGTSGRHDGQSVAFVCECDDPTCYAIVRLDAAEFEENRVSRVPITLPGHRAHAQR